MANERLTEQITRKLLEKANYYYDEDIIVEEQQTDIKNIRKLLSKASKKNNGQPGYPDFIITNKRDPESVIIIECKADAKKIGTVTGVRYELNAIDGALFYRKFLKDNFNVVTIAIAGATPSTAIIRTFKSIKGYEGFYELHLGNTILNWGQYFEGEE
jgi:type I restriction enzyme M protein